MHQRPIALFLMMACTEAKLIAALAIARAMVCSATDAVNDKVGK